MPLVCAFVCYLCVLGLIECSHIMVLSSLPISTITGFGIGAQVRRQLVYRLHGMPPLLAWFCFKFNKNVDCE